MDPDGAERSRARSLLRAAGGHAIGRDDRGRTARVLMAAPLILGIGVAACSLPALSESASSPSATAPSASDTSPEATGLEDGNGEELSGVLLARAYSAGFSTADERTAALPPDIIVFQDGLVVARVDTPPEPPTYRECS